MNILAIDTVTHACSVALLTGSKSYQKFKIAANQHSEWVLGMVDAVLQESRLSLAGVDLIAVNNGPGSFTGIRIGLGVAQGLAYGANKPLIGINSLAILAAQSLGSCPVLAMIDARMGQIYWGCFKDNPTKLPTADWADRQITPLHLTKLEEIPTLLDAQDLSIIASGCAHYADRLRLVMPDKSSDANAINANAINAKVINANVINADAYPKAADLAVLAAGISAADYQSAAQLSPIYLRDKVASVSTKKPLFASPKRRN